MEGLAGQEDWNFATLPVCLKSRILDPFKMMQLRPR